MGKSASSVSSYASSVASSLSNSASKSSSAASASASSASSSLSNSASQSASSVSAAAASASARAAGKNPTLATTSYSTLSIIGIVFTGIIAALVAAHFSGALNPLYEWVAEKFFKAEAKAEMVALEKTGSKKAEAMLKDRLKDNPMADLADGELDDIAQGKGLGDKLGKIGGGKLGL